MTRLPDHREPIRDPEVLKRMQITFDLYEAAEQVIRQNLRRRNPAATEQEIEEGLRMLASGAMVVPFRPLGRSPKRALRRHHASRRKAWVRRNLPHYLLDPHEPPPRRVGLYANTPKVCSCWMCGNPRRYLNEPTLQERVHEEAGRWEDP